LYLRFHGNSHKGEGGGRGGEKDHKNCLGCAPCELPRVPLSVAEENGKDAARNFNPASDSRDYREHTPRVCKSRKGTLLFLLLRDTLDRPRANAFRVEDEARLFALTSPLNQRHRISQVAPLKSRAVRFTRSRGKKKKNRFRDRYCAHPHRARAATLRNTDAIASRNALRSFFQPARRRTESSAASVARGR